MVIFCFAYLKMNDTRDDTRMVTTYTNSPYANYVKTNAKYNLLSIVEKSLMFYITAQAKYTHFKKSCNILLFKNIYAMYKSK